MAAKKQQDWEPGQPAHVSQESKQDPAPGVSNADIDLSAVSLDGRDATTQLAEEQNPEGHRPPPGPQYEQVLGTPTEGHDTNDDAEAAVEKQAGGGS
jgi:hypothetical protein